MLQILQILASRFGTVLSIAGIRLQDQIARVDLYVRIRFFRWNPFYFVSNFSNIVAFVTARKMRIEQS